jgi:hypothetical protein
MTPTETDNETMVAVLSNRGLKEKDMQHVLTESPKSNVIL